MLAEYEVVQALDNVLLVFRIVLVQSFNELGLDKALFIETLLILEDLQRNELFLFMVENAQHNSERSLSQFLDHFIAIGYMLIVTANVFLTV